MRWLPSITMPVSRSIGIGVVHRPVARMVSARRRTWSASTSSDGLKNAVGRSATQYERSACIGHLLCEVCEGIGQHAGCADATGARRRSACWGGGLGETMRCWHLPDAGAVQKSTDADSSTVRGAPSEIVPTDATPDQYLYLGSNTFSTVARKVVDLPRSSSMYSGKTW